VPASVALACVEGVLDGSPENALISLDYALEQDPDYARGYTYRSWLLRILGRVEENIVAIHHAVELDPHSVHNRHSLAWGLFCSGDPEGALAVERELRAAHQQDDIAYAYLAIAAAYLGHHEEAVDSAFEAIQYSRGNPNIQAAAAYVLSEAGDSDQARELLRDAESATLPRAPRAQLAAAYVSLGDYAYALELLRKAKEERCIWLRPAKLDPRFAALIDEPGFTALFE